MPRTAGLSHDDIDTRWNHIDEMTRFGASVTQICEQLGVSRATVSRVRRQRGLNSAHRTLTDHEVAAIDRMLTDGCSLAEAARTFGVTRSAVWKRFRGRGWTRQQVAEWSALVRSLRERQADII